MKYPRSPQERVAGIVYFGRMLDKIRLRAAGELHPDLQANLGIGFDQRCADFFHISYPDLAAEVMMGMSDEDALAWCGQHGRKPSETEIFVWSEFMRKRGWEDDGTEMLLSRKKEAGMIDRADIRTMFEFIDADEGRLPAS